MRGAQAYREVESKVVSETIFSQFMYKILPTCNHLPILEPRHVAPNSITAVTQYSESCPKAFINVLLLLSIV